MILVTGASGTTGRDVVNQLASLGAPVRALCTRGPYRQAFSSPLVETLTHDPGDLGCLDQAMVGVEKLCLHALPGPAQVEFECSVIEKARQRGVKCILKISALGADRGAPVKAIRWHGEAEEALKASGIAFAILRPNVSMQHTLGFATEIALQNAVYGSFKEGRISLIDARDVAAVAATLLTTGRYESQTYLLTGPEAFSLSQVVEKISRATGRKISYVDIPPEALSMRMLYSGLTQEFAADLVALQVFFSSGRGADVTTTVEDLTGTPARRYDAFVREYAHVFRGDEISIAGGHASVR